MPARRELFPHVIEMNHQARRRLGCCVYLVHDQSQWLLIDIGYEDQVMPLLMENMRLFLAGRFDEMQNVVQH